MPDAITLLTSDHRQVESLYAQLGDGTSFDPAVVDQIVKLLSVHDAIEKQLLYPALDKVQGGEPLAARSLEEHQKVEELLNRVEKAEEPQAKLTALRETMQSVSQHVAEEESQVFPTLRSALTAEDLERLGNQLESAKAAAPTHPHPSSPNSGIGATVVGTASGLIDKAKDAVAGRPADQ